MKVTPLLPFDPELLAEIEAVLQEGETASAFIETSVRSAVEFRRMKTSFHERGDAAWDDYQSTGASVPADKVVAKLQAKLDAKRKKLGG